MHQLLFILATIALASAVFPTDTIYSANYDSKTGEWSVKEGKGGVAQGILYDTQNQNGWFTLEISTDGVSHDEAQAYASGFLDAALNQLQIWQAWLVYEETNQFPPNLMNFIQTQIQWLKQQVAGNPQDPYWVQVGLTLQQFQGIVDGYQKYAPSNQHLTYWQILLFQMSDEIGDIISHFQPADRVIDPDFFDSHCSVLIRVSSDGKSLFASHDTWSSFTGMLRTYKFYKLNFNHPSTKATTVAFSSYPSFLMSSDDYYITNQKLVVMETTNEILNQTLYTDYVKPESVPFWIRVVLANRMSSNGAEWAQIFAKYNSGTYNNQFQVVDYKLFTPGQPIQKNTLWIIEQVPGFVESSDESDFLSGQGFWPSYNVPYFPFIYNISGYVPYFQKFGNEYSYSECARAQIFRRDAGKVETFEDMKKIMRYNNFQNDPLSLRDACRGISARCDLNTPWTTNTLNGMSPFGGIDSKITDNTMVSSLLTQAVCGPTWDDQPPFAWTEQWKSFPSYGMPNIFAFDFTPLKPTTF